jgi:hypothetical protein
MFFILTPAVLFAAGVGEMLFERGWLARLQPIQQLSRSLALVAPKSLHSQTTF